MRRLVQGTGAEMDNEPIKATLQRDLEQLQAAHAELLVEAQIDHVDVRSQWNRIDDALRFARSEIDRLGDDSTAAACEIEASSRALLDDVKRHVDRIRSSYARISGAR
jgi:hypothetical protein